MRGQHLIIRSQFKDSRWNSLFWGEKRKRKEKCQLDNRRANFSYYTSRKKWDEVDIGGHAMTKRCIHRRIPPRSAPTASRETWQLAHTDNTSTIQTTTMEKEDPICSERYVYWIVQDQPSQAKICKQKAQRHTQSTPCLPMQSHRWSCSKPRGLNVCLDTFNR